MKPQDLSLEQLKEIVDGAPEGAEHVNLTPGYYRNVSFCTPEEDEPPVAFFTEWAGPRYRSWTFDEWNDFTSADPRIVKNAVDINDLRARIAELEAQSNTNVTLSAGSIENKGVDGSEKITVKLDPAKCRVVDPALPYDEPAKRRVGWVSCLDFGAIGDALQGNQSNFDAMSEKHRSPSCKCHEFPFDAELEAPAGMKHDQGKPRYSLIPAGALALVVDVLEYEATKYAPNGWKHVKNARERYYNAAMRHLQQWWSGEWLDSESGLPHLAHVACCVMFLIWLGGEGASND